MMLETTPHPRRWWALAVIALAQFMVIMDTSIIGGALPDMAALAGTAGMALAFIPSLGTALSAARPEEGGLASGIVNTFYQVGSALGLAAMTAVATAYGAGQVGDPAALTDGFSAAFLGAAATAAAGGLLAWLTLRQPAPPGPAVERGTSQPASQPSAVSR